MKLQLKFAIYSALSKVIIILIIGMILPVILRQTVYNHIDKRLRARTERVMKIINRGGINEIVMEQDCSFESYNILKEEFVSIKPLPNINMEGASVIVNEEWSVESERLKHRIIRTPFIYDNQMYELSIGEGLSTVEQLNSTLSKFTWIMMIVIIIATVFADVAFVRVLLRPFNRIVNQKLRLTKDVSAFDYTPMKTSTHEFNYLDQSLNEMMKKIRDAFNVEKEFISNVSHELLTPVSILQNRFENIIAEGQVAEDVENKLLESQKTLNRLSRIIKALLFISKIENAQYIKDEKVEVSSLVDDVLNEIQERFSEKGISVNKQFYDTFTIQQGNKTLLHTMFFNIINNAVKYNRSNGSITITGKQHPERYVLEISDSGIGIEKNHLPNIFDRFKTFNKTSEKGYGLGLPIVKTIATFHSITIRVNSEVNVGTSFELVFAG